MTPTLEQIRAFVPTEDQAERAVQRASAGRVRRSIPVDLEDDDVVLEALFESWKRLRAEARRWYLADGTFEELTPEVVLERRKQAARELAAWRQAVEAANRIAQEHDAARAKAEEANRTLVEALDVAQHQARLANGLAEVRQEELLRVGAELAEMRRRLDDAVAGPRGLDATSTLPAWMPPRVEDAAPEPVAGDTLSVGRDGA